RGDGAGRTGFGRTRSVVAAVRRHHLRAYAEQPDGAVVVEPREQRQCRTGDDIGVVRGLGQLAYARHREERGEAHLEVHSHARTPLGPDVSHDLLCELMYRGGDLVGLGEVGLIGRLVAVRTRNPRGVVDGHPTRTTTESLDVRPGVGPELRDQRALLCKREIAYGTDAEAGQPLRDAVTDTPQGSHRFVAHHRDPVLLG